MIGCSSDSSTGDGGADGALDTQNPMDVQNPMDTGSPDSGTLGKLLAIHASPDLPPIRFCYLVNGALSPLPPLPQELSASQIAAGAPFAGLYQGTGGPLPSTGTDLGPLKITPILIKAQKIAQYVKGGDGGIKVCSDLLAPDAGFGLVEGTDYWTLSEIPANTFGHDHTYLLALTGCRKDTTIGGGNAQLTAAKCGANWNNTTGNLAVKIYDVDRKIADPQKMGAQFLHLSAIVSAGSVGITPGIITPGANDGGNLLDLVALSPVQYPDLKPATATGVTKPAALNANPALNTAFVGTPVLPNDAGFGTQIYLPLPTVEQLTTGYAPDGGLMYQAGGNFTFVAMGDPTVFPYLDSTGAQGDPKDGGKFNGYYIHVIGLPNDPVIPKL
jgi:hypothetical protein